MFQQQSSAALTKTFGQSHSFQLGDRSTVEALAFRWSTTDVCEYEPQVPRIRSIGKASTDVHDTSTDEFFDLAIEVLHSVGVPICHRFEKRLAILLALFYILARSKR